jgi:hypothetical protein
MLSNESLSLQEFVLARPLGANSIAHASTGWQQGLRERRGGPPGEGSLGGGERETERGKRVTHTLVTSKPRGTGVWGEVKRDRERGACYAHACNIRDM